MSDPRAALYVFLGVTGAQRVLELVVSARHARRLASRGAREFGGRHFPGIAALHAGYLVSLAVEVLVLGARPSAATPAWLALWVGAQALRYAAMRALGDRWNVRVWVEPGRARVRAGPYRLLPHPNYVAVVVELVAGPMIFGAWRTAAWVGIADAVLLRRRIQLEDRALRWAERRAAATRRRGVEGMTRDPGRAASNLHPASEGPNEGRKP